MKKLLVLLVAVGLFNLVACGGNEEKGAAEKAQDAVEQKANEVKEAAEEAKDAVKDAANEAKDAVKDAVNDAKNAGEQAASGKDGKTLFIENGCVACHKEKEKSVGPALKDIAAKYAGKQGDLVKFLKGEGEAIVDPAQFAVMQPNLNITKAMSDADLKALTDYILSIK